MKPIESYNVCFLGRTGNGKTSLINALWGTTFETDPLVSCTKRMFSVTIMDDVPNGKEGLTAYDVPGIGEFSSDSKYERYYQHVVSIADCIVLVTTFDRTDAPSQRLLIRLKPFVDKDKDVKFIIALNHIDSTGITDIKREYEPWNSEANEPTEKCVQNIAERISILHERFDNIFLPFEVVPVCAMRHYGIDKLKTLIKVENYDGK